MKILLVIAIQFLIFTASIAQNSIAQLLTEVEKNNTGLAALRSQLDARCIAGKTGIYPQNPEFEYAWQKGSPAGIGSKTTISLRQHFDFPTAYLHKIRIANARNDQLILEYENQRYQLLYETRLICLEIIHTNIKAAEYSRRLQNAQRMADAYEIMFDAGETNIVEYNKARLSLLALQKETERNEIQRNALLNKLAGMNGGKHLSLNDTIFDPVAINADFEEWYQLAAEKNPALKWLRQEIEISLNNEKLQRAMNLPGFNAGYVSEMLAIEEFRGFAIGVTIPLWENKNTLKYAKAFTSTMESREQDKKLQYYSEMKTLHNQAISLYSSHQEYNTLLQAFNNSALLVRAWEEGEISLTSYLLELSYYYTSIDKLMEMELELHKTLALLNRYLD